MPDDITLNNDTTKEYCIKNGSYVRIADDAMTAWIMLKNPAQGEAFYSKELIMQFLGEHGITAGFHTSNIAAIAKKHVYEREIPVAKGAASVDGTDGYYEWLMDVTKYDAPLIREDGSADYSVMSRVASVQEGQEIAIYHNAVPGTDGYDVFGRVTPAKPGKELPPLKCRGASNEKDHNKYVALSSGRVEYSDGVLDIKNCHQISGNVDLIIGKVEFFGDIEISGDVETGVIIRASRNVTINGTVGGATIYAGGDITIRRGVSGGQKARIVARGNVQADFLENCTVEAGGTIRSNFLLDTIAKAGNQIIAEGKSGSIIAGSARGLKGVVATIIGNDSEKKTTVAAGYSAEEYARYLELHQTESAIQKDLADIAEQLSDMLKEKRTNQFINPVELENRLSVLSSKKDALFDKLDKVVADKEAQIRIIESGKGSSVTVNDRIYRNSVVCVEGYSMTLQQNDSFMKYVNEGGRVVGHVIAI